MKRNLNKNDPITHVFPLLSRVPNLVHGVFTRHGGVSSPPYDSLNVVWNNGDSREAVEENLRRIKTFLQLDYLVAARQTHGDVIHLVDDHVLAQSENHSSVRLVPPGDALVTRMKGTGLMIKIADCQAVFLVDPVQKVIANIHSGWRGSVKAIIPKVVQFMGSRFNTRPEDLLAAISPSLGPCCGEFRNYRNELPPPFWAFQTRPQYFDFWAISRRQLLEAGLNPEHIEIANRCTVCETNDFFSYRGEGVTGRMAAVLAWKQDQ